MDNLGYDFNYNRNSTISEEPRIGQSEIAQKEQVSLGKGDMVSAARIRKESGGNGSTISYPPLYNDSDYGKALSAQSTYLSAFGSAKGSATKENQYITREKNRIEAQKNSKAYREGDDLFGIGTVYLDIPPTQINVSNEAHNFRYSSLRSPGEVVVTSGRTTTRIDLQIMFNGFDDINDNLRSLLAQFKTTPFLPIENSYLTNILNPFNKELIDINYLKSKKSQLKEMEKRGKVLDNLLKTSSGIGALNAETKEKLNKLSKKGYLNNYAYNLLMAHMDDIRGIPPGELQDEDWKTENGQRVFNMEHYLRRNMTVPLTGNFDMMTVERDLTEVREIQDEISAMEKKAEQYNLDSIDEKFRDRQLVGVLSQISISTVPGFPETLSCNLSMYVFNYDPFSIDFSFISEYNPDKPTPDITKCEMFIEWYSKRWLVPREDVNKMSLGLYTGSEKMEFVYITKMEPVNSTNLLNTVNVQKSSFSIEDGIIITGITASIRNIIQFLPILSSKNPTCQYMGAMNSDVQITMECVDPTKLNELCRMIEKIGVISRTKNRLTRNNFVYVSNELLAMLAMLYFYISDYSVDTVPGNPGLSTITINLTEYKPGQEEFQILKREGVTSQSEVELTAEWILDRARDFIVNKKTQYRTEYWTVADEKFGWFNKKTSIVESFLYGIGGGSDQNDSLRQEIFSRCGNISVASALLSDKRIKKYVIEPFKIATSKIPLVNVIQPALDTDKPSISVEMKYGLLSKDRYLYTKDYIGYARSFLRSIPSVDDTFFNANKKTIARVAAIIKRNDIVKWILFNNKNPELNEYLNNKKDKSGDSIRNKEDLDAGKVSCYPDLDLPKYGDIPDGYKLMNTLKEVGSMLAGKDPDKAAQSMAAEVDPDFFMWKGSIWDSVDESVFAGDAVEEGIKTFKKLALSNQNYREHNKDLDEDVVTEFLSSKQKDNLGERYVIGLGSVKPELRNLLENPKTPAYVAMTKDNGQDVLNVHDGDTLMLNVDGKEFSVRLLGYNAPEIKSSDSKNVTDLYHAKLARNELIKLVQGKQLIVEVSGIDTDTYGRPLVNLWTTKDGKTKDRGGWINDQMLRKSKELNLQYISSVDNSYDLTAEQTFLKSHENYINTIRKESGVYRYDMVTGWEDSTKSSMGLRLAYHFRNFLTPAGFSVALDAASNFGLLKLGAILGGWINTSPEQAGSRAMDDMGVFMKSVAKSVPPPLANFVFPENMITNDLDAVVSKAVTKKTQNRNLFRFDREADQNIELISSKIRGSQKDDTLRMSRAFPTFKVYFIEEDMPEWGRLDDEYSYQGVSSIDITKSRQEAADVAVITFLNTKGTLDRSLFGLYSKSGEYVMRENPENYDPVKQETKFEQNLDEFVLKVGTIIKVKMGYHSDPDLLETVFTGMVAEVSGGDIVTVVAQGFGVELLNKVPKASFYTSAASAFKVLDRLIASPDVVHFGKWNWFPRATAISKVFYRRYRKDEKTGRFTAPSWWRKIGGIDFLLTLADDTRNNNIWVPENSFWYNLTHGGSQTFVTQDKTIWDVFREMARRYPGYITTVLPFDNRATVYFGPADFMYWYTDKNKDEVIRFENNEFDAMHIPDDKKLSQLVNDDGYQELGDEDLNKLLGQAANYLTYLLNEVYQNSRVMQGRVRKLIDCLNKKYSLGKVYYFSGMAYDVPGDVIDEPRAISFCEILAQSDLGSSTQDQQNKNMFDFIARTIKNPSNGKISGRIVQGSPIIAMATGRVFDEKVELSFHSSGKKYYMSPRGEIFDTKQAIRKWDEMKGQTWAETDSSRKLVRQYHFKDSFHHIVSNNIVATSQYMYNKITVEYGLEVAWKAKRLWESAPGFSRVSAQIDDDIWMEKIREKIIQERNARDVITAWNYALGNLWEEARKMYSGHLVMLGDPSIKPYDIIMLNDYFTDMFGPIEVEQVTHHFSSDTGFVTTIVPNLMCYVNNAMQQGSVTVAGSYNNAVTNFVQNIRGVASMFGGPILGEPLARVAFWATGLSTGRREPISFTPLIYAGRPFIAGVEGMRKDGLIEAINGKIVSFILQTNRTRSSAKAVYDTIRLQTNDNQMFGR